MQYCCGLSAKHMRHPLLSSSDHGVSRSRQAYAHAEAARPAGTARREQAVKLYDVSEWYGQEAFC